MNDLADETPKPRNADDKGTGGSSLSELQTSRPSKIVPWVPTPKLSKKVPPTPATHAI